MVLALGGLFSGNALAFNYPLQPEEIEQAYALGRTTNHEDLANFLNQYEHDFKIPESHPLAYVTSVEFQTPYERIALASLKSAQYTKFKAAEDYKANAGAVVVRVVVALRMVLHAPVPAEDSFRVIVSQETRIEPERTTTKVLCNPYEAYGPYPTGDSCTIYLREILLRFKNDQLAPGQVKVTVQLPEDRSLETKYNLDDLK